MTEPSKAQRLANLLDLEQVRTESLDIMHNYAAAELRRLDALNAELVEALEDAIDSMGRFTSEEGSTDRDFVILDNAIAALAKAKEQT